MDIVNIKVADIKPYPKNTKKHPAEQISNIAKSIEKYGFIQPIVLDKNNEIVIGHGRILASKKLKMQEVPCVYAENLSEEDIKALRIIDNKLNESEWDADFLKEELAGIDLSDFDLNFDDVLAEDETEEAAEIVEDEVPGPIDYKEETKERVRDILNLEKSEFPGVGFYDIPKLNPIKKLPKIKEWIGFNYVLSDNNPEGKAVHFFIDDYQFERLWNNPEKYVEKLKQYVCVATPDFSPYGDMPHALQIYNHYRKHWIGAFLQSHGIKVIPTIRCSTDKRSFDWFLDGEPQNGIVLISSMWTKDNSIVEESKKEYQMMKEKLKPKKIFIYGGYSGNMGILETDNVEYIQSFTEKRWSNAKEK